jgi:UTP--glucose-1-phosphate uridylyltransferase
LRVIQRTLVEKPAPEEAHSDLAIASRHLSGPDIFPHIANVPHGVGGEIQLTDAMCRLAEDRQMYGREIEGERLDVGNRGGLFAALGALMD